MALPESAVKAGMDTFTENLCANAAQHTPSLSAQQEIASGRESEGISAPPAPAQAQQQSSGLER